MRINGESRLESRHTSLAEVARAAGTRPRPSSPPSSWTRASLDQGFDLYDDRVDAAEGAVFPSGMNERPAERTTDAALAWLGARDRRKPFLAWVHYFDAHAPYAPPEPFAGRFAGSPYDGEIAFMDAQIGRLLEGLDAAGQRDRTLVSSWGTTARAGRPRRSGPIGVPLPLGDPVPLIVSNPRLFPRPAVVDGTVVSLADVAPTVLDLLAGARPPATA